MRTDRSKAIEGTVWMLASGAIAVLCIASVVGLFFAALAGAHAMCAILSWREHSTRKRN